ncbi:hypothetical protein ACLK1T_19385 [Escherichia coli]
MKPRAERCCCMPQQLSWNWWDDVTVEIRLRFRRVVLQPALSGNLSTNGDYAHIAE